MREVWRNYYANNKEKVKAVNIRVRKESIAKAHAILAKIKSKPCKDCGGVFIKEAMEFDHVRGDKIAEVSDLARNGNHVKMLEEIEKCDLVCANCHRVRTVNRRGQPPHTCAGGKK